MSKKLSHIDPQGKARMVDVSAKVETARMARAEAVVRLGADIAKEIRKSGGLAKGPVFETAKIAGILAAKKTGELIPLCHPLGLDHIDLTFDLRDDHVRIEASAVCNGKTGVEMEAMTAVSVAALTVYDMVKAASKSVEILSIRLLEKSGGKSGDWERGDEGKKKNIPAGARKSKILQAVVITVSDRRSKGKLKDTAGPAVCALLKSALRANILEACVLPDEEIPLREKIRDACDNQNADLVLTVGGTGFAARDLSPEALRPLIHKATPGLDEQMRRVSVAKVPTAFLSRATSGIRGQSLIVNLPGSEKGAVENLQALLPGLKHGLGVLRGEELDCGKPNPSKSKGGKK